MNSGQWNPFKPEVVQWAKARLLVLRSHLAPEAPAIKELRAAGVRESVIENLYPSDFATWQRSARQIINRGIDELNLTPRTSPCSVLLLIQANYASAREVSIALSECFEMPRLDAARKSVALTAPSSAHSAPNSTQESAAAHLGDSLALACFLAQMICSPDPKAYRASLPNFEARWDMNFPSYQIVLDRLCSLLNESGWRATPATP